MLMIFLCMLISFNLITSLNTFFEQRAMISSSYCTAAALNCSGCSWNDHRVGTTCILSDKRKNKKIPVLLLLQHPVVWQEIGNVNNMTLFFDHFKKYIWKVHLLVFVSLLRMFLIFLLLWLVTSFLSQMELNLTIRPLCVVAAVVDELSWFYSCCLWCSTFPFSRKCGREMSGAFSSKPLSTARCLEMWNFPYYSVSALPGSFCHSANILISF